MSSSIAPSSKTQQEEEEEEKVLLQPPQPDQSLSAAQEVVTRSTGDDEAAELSSPTRTASQQSSMSQRAISQTLATTANLANLLPTGTLLAFQILTPIFTTNGSCDSATRVMTFLLLVLLATSCFVASFTDSIKYQGQVYHGFATSQGMWLFDYPADDNNPEEVDSLLKKELRRYKRRWIDVIHGVLSVLVFASVALKDRNVLSCFYPTPGHETQEVLNILPVGIGIICSLLFVVFPTQRHGIGFPVTSDNFVGKGKATIITSSSSNKNE